MRWLAALLLLVSAASRADIAVTDALGREVTLDEPAQRIVALAPHIVENLFSAGAGARIVGAVSYSNYPAAAQAIPQVGSAFTWSLESIVALAPDLVVLWSSGNGITGLHQLERLGIPVYVSEPRSFADISDSIRDFGALAGSATAAAAAADAFDADIRGLGDRYRRDTPLSVFYEIWNEPLQTVNGEHLISRVIELCGGSNIFGDEQQLAPRISLEAILERDPQAIVASGMDASRPEWLDDWRRYPGLTAVKEERLIHVHPDLIQRPTLRIAQGAADLCRQLAAN